MHISTLKAIIAILLLAFFLASAFAQPQVENPGSVPSVQPDQLRVNVLVTDADGHPVSGLGKENFRLLDNGRPATVLDLSSSTDLLTVVLLVEYSSAAWNFYAGEANAWASGFPDHLKRKDWVALVTYDIDSTVRADFTHNRTSVRDSIATIGFPSFSN